VTLPELHLAGEAIAALVDGELSRHAQGRALDHTARCPECRTAVNAQRQAKAALIAASVPALPWTLLSRLHDVPMTTDLSDQLTGGPGDQGGTLTVSGSELMWAPVDPRVATQPAAVRGGLPGSRRPQGQRAGGASRPRSYPIVRARSTRLRRGLAGTLAGLAFGVVAATAPMTGVVGGGAASEPNVVNRNPQVVPAGVGVGLNLPTRKDSGTRGTTQIGTRGSSSSDPIGTVIREVAAAR
jgi:hypothetical protein